LLAVAVVELLVLVVQVVVEMVLVGDLMAWETFLEIVVHKVLVVVVQLVIQFLVVMVLRGIMVLI
tara:strand:- start:338 stop:532 length:195 start_codon:yes stop_codon:yes gene_type:complete